jgi:GR25 family glycosyltransferase involved in LPS biosynthesis
MENYQNHHLKNFFVFFSRMDYNTTLFTKETKYMLRNLLICILLSLNALSAINTKFLKKPINKEGPYNLRNIDFIYMINLDARPQKYQMSLDQLSAYGITPYRFSAVNGWEIPLEDLDSLATLCTSKKKLLLMGTYYIPTEDGRPTHEALNPGKRYFSHCMPRGSIGIVLSHLSILKDAYESGYQTIWVMEDDIQVIRDPRILPDLIDELDHLVGKNGWDILFTDRDTKGQDGKYVACNAFATRPDFTPSDPSKCTFHEKINSEFRRIGARYGAYSMIVRRSGMKKLLDFYKNRDIFLPFDMEYTLPDDIKLVTVRHDVVSTMPKALSDNGVPGYLGN